MDLKDFSKVKLDDDLSEKNTQKTNSSDEIVSIFLKNFGKLSEDELLNEMKIIVEKQKQDGTYDEKSMQGLLKRIGPFLNSDQQQKINQIFGLND